MFCTSTNTSTSIAVPGTKRTEKKEKRKKEKKNRGTTGTLPASQYMILSLPYSAAAEAVTDVIEIRNVARSRMSFIRVRLTAAFYCLN